MATSSVKPLEVISKEQYEEIKEKQDWRNVLSISSNWLQMSAAMTLFFFYPNVITFLVALVIIGSRQFALAVLAHDAAHNLLFENNKVNDWAGQWFCAYPIFQDNRVYRPYHLKHHRHTETDDDPDLVLSSPFPITKRSFIRKVFRDLTGITGVKRYWGSLSSIFRTKGDNVFNKISKTSNKLHGFLISNLIIFILISTTMHWSLFLLLWWLPSFTYYSLIIRIRNISEHAVTPGNNDFDNTRTTKSTVLTRFLMVPHNVNYHLEHHLFTRCPWYNLPKAHSMMIENGYEDKMCLENSYKNVLLKAVSA
ncbi:fatty acid desaturase family protein [Gammaproteobacteria bacterium]|nr:fatty acid desaturase family protein [Gammaproteobacteria bacterium]